MNNDSALLVERRQWNGEVVVFCCANVLYGRLCENEVLPRFVCRALCEEVEEKRIKFPEQRSRADEVAGKASLAVVISEHERLSDRCAAAGKQDIVRFEQRLAGVGGW